MKKMMLFMLLALVCSTASAQITQKDKDDFFGTEDKDDFFGKGTKEDFYGKNDPGFAAERQKMYENYNKFRKEMLKDYSDFVRKAWKDYEASPAVAAPKDEHVEPQLAPGADAETASLFSKLFGRKHERKQKPKPQPKPANQKPVQYTVQEVVKPEPMAPQAQPQVQAQPKAEKANDYMKFMVFGTECKVRIGDNCRFRLRSIGNDDVADAIEHVPRLQRLGLLPDAALADPPVLWRYQRGCAGPGLPLFTVWL